MYSNQKDQIRLEDVYRSVHTGEVVQEDMSTIPQMLNDVTSLIGSESGIWFNLKALLTMIVAGAGYGLGKFLIDSVKNIKDKADIARLVNDPNLLNLAKKLEDARKNYNETKDFKYNLEVQKYHTEIRRYIKDHTSNSNVEHEVRTKLGVRKGS